MCRSFDFFSQPRTKRGSESGCVKEELREESKGLTEGGC